MATRTAFQRYSNPPNSTSMGFSQRETVIAGTAFCAAAAVFAFVTPYTAAAVYAVSFWQYAVYALAFLHRRVSLEAFQHDAYLTRTASLVAFAWVYLSSPIDVLSLAVVLVGFALNIAAVKALGTDRTYYGVELAALQPKRITAFPYTWIPHPMLVGNMAAFGGAMLNAEFARQWWPLAVLHVGLNLAIILMEAYAKPVGTRNAESSEERQPFDAVSAAFEGGLAGAAVGAAFAALVDPSAWAAAMTAGAGVFAYAAVLADAYLPKGMLRSFTANERSRTAAARTP
jgi:hypothetical protein